MTGLEIIALVGIVSATIVIAVAITLRHQVRARGRYDADGAEFDLHVKPKKDDP